MKRELGIARCGLACCLCSENVKCNGCDSANCPDYTQCENRKCSIEKGFLGCFACETDCKKGLLSKIKPYGFTLFIKRYGIEKLLDCLEENELRAKTLPMLNATITYIASVRCNRPFCPVDSQIFFNPQTCIALFIIPPPQTDFLQVLKSRLAKPTLNSHLQFSVFLPRHLQRYQYCRPPSISEAYSCHRL